MEPKTKRRKAGEGEVEPPVPSDPYGMFRGIVAFLVPEGVQLRRLQIWKQKLLQMGGMVENKFSERVSHVLALDSEKALEKLGPEQLKGFNGIFPYTINLRKLNVLNCLVSNCHKGFLPKLVQYLKDINFLREDLVYSIHSIEGTDSGVDTYFGLCTYPGREKRHRVDFKVYRRDIYAFGLIAWTGNDVLNRRLRLLAESKGYRLDDTGLFLATQSSGRKRGMKSSTSISCRTEKEVFDLLGFPWLEPHERNL